MSFRDIKNDCRRALHDFMAVPASFYASPSVEPPVLRSVRPHSRPAMVGDLAGTNLSYVETHDRKETVVFLLSEFPDPNVIGRGALVVISETEGYWIENRMPRDGLTVTAEVTMASPADLAGKTLPGAL